MLKILQRNLVFTTKLKTQIPLSLQPDGIPVQQRPLIQLI